MIVQSFDEVFTFEAIYRAHLRGRLSKRDKITLVKFESHMLENVYNLYQSLHKGVYRTSGYSHFTVYEPKNAKFRPFVMQTASFNMFYATRSYRRTLQSAQ